MRLSEFSWTQILSRLPINIHLSFCAIFMKNNQLLLHKSNNCWLYFFNSAKEFSSLCHCCLLLDLQILFEWFDSRWWTETSFYIFHTKLINFRKMQILECSRKITFLEHSRICFCFWLLNIRKFILNVFGSWAFELNKGLARKGLLAKIRIHSFCSRTSNNIPVSLALFSTLLWSQINEWNFLHTFTD